MRETRRLWRLRSGIAGGEFGIGVVTVLICITVILAIGMKPVIQESLDQLMHDVLPRRLTPYFERYTRFDAAARIHDRVTVRAVVRHARFLVLGEADVLVHGGHASLGVIQPV